MLSIWSCSKFCCLGKKGLNLPDDINSALSKLKAFADIKINVTQKLKFDSRRVKNILGKVENAGYKHFLLFPQCFQTFRIARERAKSVILEAWLDYKCLNDPL